LEFHKEDILGHHVIIAIDSLALGPALGGSRMKRYDSVKEQTTDVERLANGMTHKSSLAGLDLGGGKATINAPSDFGKGDNNGEQRRELFLAFGDFVESLGGNYITAEDVGTNVDDMEVVFERTKHVVGLPRYPYSRGGSGDPSIITAAGVYQALIACVEGLYKTDSLEGLTATLQGAGHVGKQLSRMLLKGGIEKLIISDKRRKKIDQLREYIEDFELATNEKYNDRIQVSHPDKIYSKKGDIFVPCALGGILNKDTVPVLKNSCYKIVCGAANNQLLDTVKDGQRLMKAGILYGPDYLVNAGGLINVYVELSGRKNGNGYSREAALEKVRSIYNTMREVIEISKIEQIPTNEVADRVAERRVSKAS